MFRPIGSLLKNTQTTPRSSGAISALRVRQVAKEAIDAEMADFGVEVLKTIKVNTFKNRVLTVSSPPMVSAELQMRAERLLLSINARSGATVARLRLRNY